jgi:hypothetical protein
LSWRAAAASALPSAGRSAPRRRSGSADPLEPRRHATPWARLLFACHQSQPLGRPLPGRSAREPGAQRPGAGGFCPEIASRQNDAADLRGCFHQAWSPTFGLAHPTIQGLWGLEPATPHPSDGAPIVALGPTPPDTWSTMSLTGLRGGGSRLSCRWERRRRGLRLRLNVAGEPLRLTVRFRIPNEARAPRAVDWAGPEARLGCHQEGRWLELLTPGDCLTLAASWALGRGQVVAVGIDCFGFGHGTLVHWTVPRPMLSRALECLLSTRPRSRSPRSQPANRGR